MSQYRITRETAPGSHVYEEVEVFVGDYLAAVQRAAMLRDGSTTLYLVQPCQTDPAVSTGTVSTKAIG